MTSGRHDTYAPVASDVHILPDARERSPAYDFIFTRKIPANLRVRPNGSRMGMQGFLHGCIEISIPGYCLHPNARGSRPASTGVRIMVKTSEVLQCPNADGVLAPVVVHDQQGMPLALDQCRSCGGVWFDRYELFRLDEGEAGKLDSVDQTSFQLPRGEHPEPLCPRCRIALTPFHDPNIPGNIQLLSCGRCGGFWANHGESQAYACYRSQRGHKKQDPKLAEEYEKMLRDSSDHSLMEGLASFGGEMGASRDFLTGLPLDGTPAETARIDQAQDFFFTALGVAARLLFWWL